MIATAIATVVIPWKHSEERAPLLEWVLRQYAIYLPDWPVIVASPPGDDWNKGRAIWGAKPLVETPVMVVSDADVWCERLSDSVAEVANGAHWSIPHLKVHRLSPHATNLVLEGRDPEEIVARYPHASYFEHPYTGMQGGGLVVLPTDTYARVPMDPRFTGWGGEDSSWGRALRVMVGQPERLNGDLWHLYHAPADRETRVRGSEENYALTLAYRDKDRREIRKLVNEGRRLLRSTPST